jgi:hypothetical protein
LLLLFVGNTTEEEKSDRGYSKNELFRELDNISSAPVVIMAHLDEGPALLYYTKHSVVGAPYHRQEAGIISSHIVMGEKFNEPAVAREILKTNSSYIFARVSAQTRNTCAMDIAFSPDGTAGKNHPLPHLMAAGICPKWLSLVPLPIKFKDVILAKVDRTACANAAASAVAPASAGAIDGAQCWGCPEYAVLSRSCGKNLIMQRSP